MRVWSQHPLPLSSPRTACHQQGVTLSFQEDRASLTLSGGPSTLAFDLSKVPGAEATPRLQALTLGLAERVCSLEQQLAGRVGTCTLTGVPVMLPSLP